MTSSARAALTMQGRGLLAGGLTAAFCGALLAERDLVRLGLVVAALPLVCLLWLRVTGGRLEARRLLTPRTIAVGEATTVSLEIDHVGPRLLDVLVHDRRATALGPAEEIRLTHLARGRTEALHYVLPGAARGVFEIGPLEFRIGDPFGMARADRQAAGTDEVTITPRIHALHAGGVEASWAAGDSRPRSFAVGNAADVAVREYRTGDDLRRVHWRSTARTGELMVRREERPRQSRCTVLLDNRSAVHRGNRTDSTLEEAVSVAASLVLHLADEGHQVRLLDAAGAWIGRGWIDANSISAVPDLLDALARLRSTEQFALLPDGLDLEDTSLLVGVFADVGERDRATLRTLRRPGLVGRAVVVAPTFGAPGAGGTAAFAGISAAPVEGRLLAEEGWRYAVIARAEELPIAWTELAR